MRPALETIIHWGDCDEQGVVFYPHYFYWMDCAYHGLLRRAGLSLRTLRAQFGLAGTPLVKASATFLAPATAEQPLGIKAAVSRWGSTSFELAYRGSSEDRPVFEGSETRVWLLAGDGGPRPGVVPREFRAALGPAGDGD